MHKWLLLLVIPLLVNLTPAQEVSLAATLQILGDEAVVERAGASNPLRVPAGSVMPFGSGDSVETGDNSRAIITYSDGSQALLLPRSTYTLVELTQLDDDTDVIDGAVNGIILFRNIPPDALFTLEAVNFTVNAGSGDFGLWGHDDELQSVFVNSGTAQITSAQNQISLSTLEGWVAVLGPTVLSVEPPHGPARSIGAVTGCTGLVATEEREGLLARQGNGRGYAALNLLPEGTTVPLVGIDEFGSRLRVQFDSGFGWVEALGIQTDCDDLRLFTGDQIEQNTRIVAALPIERPFLEPYFSTPTENELFYD